MAVTTTNDAYYKSAKANGYTVLDTSLSHTADGSGVIKVATTGAANRTIVLSSQKIEAYSYYLVTFWVKSAAGSVIPMRWYLGKSTGWQLKEYDRGSVSAGSDWTQKQFIIYTGNSKYDASNVLDRLAIGGYFSANSEVYFDDFAVYKLSSSLGGKSYEAGELLSATNQEPMPNDSKVFIVNDSDTKYVDFTQFGATIVTDPTVKEFNADGTYKTYYENETTGAGVLNANAWWGKAVNKYQAFTNNVGVYKSPKARGLLSNDTALSHTADGSGVIKFPASGAQEVYLPLPKMEAKTGYVITAWVNFTEGSSVNLQIFNGNLVTQIARQTNFASGWQRVIVFYYPGENAASDYSLRIHSSTTGAVIDDINVQPLDDDYTRECINTNKLAENKARPTFPTESKYINATFDGNGWPYLYDGNIDWDSLGTNLITDPTVKEFNADGTYKAYYADEVAGTGVVSGTKAWWGKAANNWQAFHTNASGLANYGGMKFTNSLTNETKYSHTDDGSGAIIMKKNQSHYRLPLPKLESNSTYVITFWVKFIQSNNHDIRFYMAAGGPEQMPIATNYNKFNSFNWKRVTFLVYTNDKTHSEPFIEIYNNTVGFVDDVAVYKLTDDEYAVECLNAGKLVADGVDPTEAPGAEPVPPVFPEFQPIYINATNGTEVYDYSDFDFATLGTNLIPDPTVKEFNADGTYKAYYADETTGTGTANANAWWGKAINKYQQYSAGATKPNMWFSPKSRNILSNDTKLSHTNDGSGVIALPGSTTQNYCIPLSRMETQSYYVVTFWAKFGNKSAEMRFQPSTSQTLNINYSIFNTKDTWQRVTMLIFTGASTFSEPNISFYCADKGYIDDVAVYKLDNAYGEQCVAVGKIFYKDSAAIATPNVVGYDFEADKNLMTDGSFEANGTQIASAKFGSKVFKVTAQNSRITLPRLDFSKYYLVSYYVRTKSFTSSDKVVATLVNDAGSLHTVETAASNNGWKQVTAIVYTGDHRDIAVNFSVAALTSGKEIYIDGFAIHALPEKVAKAANIIDKYVEGALDTSIVGTPKDVFGAEGDYDVQYKIWRKLVSPVKSTSTEKVTYSSLFTKCYKDYERQDKINRGFAPSGFGFRRQFSDLTSDPAHNLIANYACDDATYWADASGFVTITTEEKYEGNTSLKVNGEGLYLKKLDVKPNTVYYLTLRGMAYSDVVVAHTHFGIGVIENGTFLPFENPITSYETEHWTRTNAAKQEVTIKYPDGTWYRRTYQFNTGDNTEVYFFIKGVKGVTYLDNIEIFTAANSKPRNGSTSVENIDTTNDEETRFACDEKNNLIPNGMFDKGTEFWKNFNGMNKFVEVATSEGNKMLHYRGTNRSYYYLPTVKLEANKTYTFSFWYRTLNGEKAKFGIISLNNPRSYITAPREITSNRGEWTLVSITFKTFEESEVSLGIFNKDGEAVFDKIRLFESKYGYELSLTEDMPKGGLNFSDSTLGTEGIVEIEDEKEQEQEDEIIDDTVYEEDEIEDEEDGDDETEETTTKVIRKYKKKPSQVRIATWFIILMIVVAVVVLAGVTFLIIFLVKRKKKKAQTA